MIKFFRRIRFNLMEMNKAGMYFKYAIGEIALVVIGILIALQINNLNEKRKNEEKVKTILQQIQIDLLNDLEETSRLIKFFETRVDLANAFLKKTKPRSFFEQNFRNFANVTLSTNIFSQSNQSFFRLKDQIDLVPEHYQHLIEQLNNLYIENGDQISGRNKIAIDAMLKYKSKIFDNFNWAEDYTNNNYTEEVQEFFLNSEMNRRQIVKTYLIFIEIQSVLEEIENQSLICYLMIREIVNDTTELPEIIKDLGLHVPAHKVNDLIGTYTYASGFQNKIEFKYNVLLMSYPNSSFANKEGYVLHAVGEDSLAVSVREHLLLRFKRDSLSNIDGYYYTNTDTDTDRGYLKKVLE